MKKGKLGSKIIMDTLNGLSIGIIVALVPGALINQLVKALLPIAPQLNIILQLTGLAAIMMPVVSGACVGIIGKLTPIQTASIALAAVAGAGNFQFTKQGFIAQGSGDVINTAITIMIAYLIVQLIGRALKAYTILLVPLIVVIVGGGIGHLTLQPISTITKAIGLVVNQLSTLQPIIMGILIGVIFALLIVSPISSVGIATAINLHGIAAGSASVGIVAASFALAIYGWKVNSIGTSLAHFLGSPKMQMANLMPHPKLLIPMSVNAALLGGLAAGLHITGTPTTAGFGFSGLIGPLTALQGMDSNSFANICLVTLIYLVLPIALGLVSNFIFYRQLNFFKPQDFALNYE